MSDVKAPYLQTPAWANPARIGYGDRLLDCDKTLLEDNFKAGERHPGLIPKPRNFFQKMGDLAFVGARATTCGVFKGADYLPRLPPLGHRFNSDGSFNY